MRIAGIDYGEKRIGIAFSDLLKMLATPYGTYEVNGSVDFEYFKKLFNDYQVELIVIGLPLNMKGEEQLIATKVRDFAEELKNYTNLPVKFLDERLTSSIADDILKRSTKSWKDRKKKLDSMSACIILQEYLDSL